MEKEHKNDEQVSVKEGELDQLDKESEIEKNNKEEETPDEKIKLTSEDRIRELEDKLARTFAEMENQRRRFEKERNDAFEYGGFSFAKEALSLIDNLERSKSILESDEKLKGSDALRKTLEHFDIIHKDLISIFKKNDIKQIE